MKRRFNNLPLRDISEICHSNQINLGHVSKLMKDSVLDFFYLISVIFQYFFT